MHAFDQETTFLGGIPYRLSNNGTSFDTSKDYCNSSELEMTNGDYLSSFTQMLNQKSCRANTGNAGNWYSWPAATAGGSKSSGNELNSICPSGWQLTVNAASDPKNWEHLIYTAYNIQDNNDSKVRPQPLSFVRSGYYDQGSFTHRANYGYCWSSVAVNNSNSAYHLYFGFGGLWAQRIYNNKYNGFSVRCVSK